MLYNKYAFTREVKAMLIYQNILYGELDNIEQSFHNVRHGEESYYYFQWL